MSKARARSRFSPWRWATLTLVAGAVVVPGAACKTRSEEFYRAIYRCEHKEPERCGKTQTGEDMTCFAASQLGGHDFCAPPCDPHADGGAPDGFTCVSAGALLRACRPSAPDCPFDLHCYRTDLFADQGVCVDAPVCSSKADCPSTGSTCAFDAISQLAPTGVMFPPGGYQCLHNKCREMGCPSTEEFCLGEGFAFEGEIADLCVPTCRQPDFACPPNSFCQQLLKNFVCIPGLPGTRCGSDTDCLVGTCQSTGVEFNICSTTCPDSVSDTSPCSILNGESGNDPFICAHPEGADSYCATPRPFTGAVCALDRDCPPDQKCRLFQDSRPGECEVPCSGESRECPARGGLPHTCLQDNDRFLCTPGAFGKACNQLPAGECIGDLRCLALGTDTTSPQQEGPAICTVRCEGRTDKECTLNPLIGQNGFCGEDGHCRARVGLDAACAGHRFCRSEFFCDTDSSKCKRRPL